MLHQRPRFQPVALERSPVPLVETAPMAAGLPAYRRFEWDPAAPKEQS